MGKAASWLTTLASVAVLLAIVTVALAQDQGSRSFRFGLIGDLAYSEAHEPLLANVLEDLDRHDLQFVVHVGDLGVRRLHLSYA